MASPLASDNRRGEEWEIQAINSLIPHRTRPRVITVDARFPGAASRSFRLICGLSVESGYLSIDSTVLEMNRRINSVKSSVIDRHI